VNYLAVIKSILHNTSQSRSLKMENYLFCDAKSMAFARFESLCEADSISKRPAVRAMGYGIDQLRFKDKQRVRSEFCTKKGKRVKIVLQFQYIDFYNV